jgi:hypothetical protein
MQGRLARDHSMDVQRLTTLKSLLPPPPPPHPSRSVAPVPSNSSTSMSVIDLTNDNNPVNENNNKALSVSSLPTTKLTTAGSLFSTKRSLSSSPSVTKGSGQGHANVPYDEADQNINGVTKRARFTSSLP